MMRRNYGLLLTPAILAVVGCAATAETPPVEFYNNEPIPIAEPAAFEVVPFVEPVVRTPSKPRVLKNERNAHFSTVNSAAVYRYVDDKIFRVFVGAPGTLTTLYLEAGEHTVGETPVLAGDRVVGNWFFVEKTMGTGDAATSIITIAPGRPGVKTSAVLITNRRAYQLDIVSRDDWFMDSVRFTFPEAPVEVATAAPVIQTPTVDFSTLYRNYKIAPYSGSSPQWTPVGAFDVSGKTMVEFGTGVGTTINAPIPYEVGADGLARAVQYKMNNNFYEISGVYSTLELRGDGSIVRLTRGGA